VILSLSVVASKTSIASFFKSGAVDAVDILSNLGNTLSNLGDGDKSHNAESDLKPEEPRPIKDLAKDAVDNVSNWGDSFFKSFNPESRATKKQPGHEEGMPRLFDQAVRFVYIS
jgi:hypothetical protein